MKISAVIAAKNRTEHLQSAVWALTHVPEINEIVVIDWSSNTPIKLDLYYNHDKSIKLIRIENEKEWIASHVWNLAVNLTQGDFVLKIDADYLLHPDFLKINPPIQNAFYQVYGVQRNDNELNLTGLILLEKNNFLAVNGYNELIITWGFEDLDLCQRLINIGLKKIYCKLDYAWHIPHPSNRRLPNKNAELAQNYPWGLNCQQSKFKIENNVGYRISNPVHPSIW